MWSSEPQKGLAFCGAKTVSSFLRYVKTLIIGPAKDPKLCLVSPNYIAYCQYILSAGNEAKCTQ